MSRRITILILVIAMTIGTVSACGLYRYSTTMMATTDLVVPVKEIEPYSVVTPDMVELRAFPEAIAQAELYRSVDEVIGKLATTTLVPGQLIYVHQLTAPQYFRYTDNDEFEVVSFPVKPEQAVGAQVRIGQRVNVYRPDTDADAIGAGLLVVDVREASGGYFTITVAAPSKVVHKIMQSGVSARDALWVTLAPMPHMVEAQP